MTTVVDPTVSARVGKETFFNSARTSVMKMRIDSVIRLNMILPSRFSLHPETYAKAAAKPISRSSTDDSSLIPIKNKDTLKPSPIHSTLSTLHRFHLA